MVSTSSTTRPDSAPVRTPKDGGIFRMYLHTENAPTLDPYFNTSFRSQEFAGFFYSRLIMSTKGPGIPSLAYIFEGDLAIPANPAS